MSPPKMMRKFAEDDRIEQMNAQKRRMKQLEHKRAVERLIEQRRAQHLRDKEAEVEERREEERLEGLRREIIEQERRKLLREHAAQLLGYLPKVGPHYSLPLATFHVLASLGRFERVSRFGYVR